MMEAIQKPLQHFQNTEKVKNPDLKNRAYAFYIDLFIIGVISHLLIIGYESVLIEMNFISPKGKSLLISNLNKMKIPLTFFVFWSYFSLSFYFSNGFSLGKRFFNLRVQRKNQKELSFLDCSLRTLGYLVCYASFFSLFAISFLRKDKKGIPDFLSKTNCVNYKELSLDFSKPSKPETEQIAA